MAYLKRLPVSEVKIDRSFLTAIEWQHNDRAIVKAAIRLAHDLGLTIVAKGVETARALELLESWRCDIAQAYYLGRPVRAADLSRRLLRDAQPAVTDRATAGVAHC